MNSGHLYKTRAPKPGFGWRWSAKRVGLWALPSVTVPNRPAAAYGSPYPPTIANVPSVTLIFGMRMPACCPANGIVPWAKKPVRPHISSASTTHSDNAVPISCAKRFHSAKISTGMKYASVYSSITTTSNSNGRVVSHQFRMYHYLYSLLHKGIRTKYFLTKHTLPL